MKSSRTFGLSANPPRPDRGISGGSSHAHTHIEGHARAARRGDSADRAPEIEGTLLEGRNAVAEALHAGRAMDKLFVAEGMRHTDLMAMAKQAGIPIVVCERRRLDRMSQTGHHQGVIAQAAACAYAPLEKLFAAAEAKNEPPLFVVCDGIEDPHNLGAIARSAEGAGAHGLIIPKRRAVGLTPAAERAAAGAFSLLAVHRASNLASTLDALKARGVWLFGAEADGDTTLYDAPFDRPAALLVGSEGRGLSRLTRDKCDYMVRIPLRGQLNSLNASNAAAVLLFEAVRKRMA